MLQRLRSYFRLVVSKAAHRAFRLNLSMSVKYICLNVFAGRLLLFGEFVYFSVCLFFFGVCIVSYFISVGFFPSGFWLFGVVFHICLISGGFVLCFDHFVSFVTLAILHLLDKFFSGFVSLLDSFVFLQFPFLFGSSSLFYTCYFFLPKK